MKRRLVSVHTGLDTLLGVLALKVSGLAACLTLQDQLSVLIQLQLGDNNLFKYQASKN